MDLFEEIPLFIEFLKNQTFDVGIGGLYHADSLLFRALGLNYLKITPEDVEGYTMAFKLGMPVQLSSYPNSKSYSAFEYNDLPAASSYTFRWKAFKDYIKMKFSRFMHLRKLRSMLPMNLGETLMDEFDQDHAMIIQEGTDAGLFASIMNKPPNVKTVYPMRKVTRHPEQIYSASHI